MSNLTDAAYDATAALRVTSRAAHARPHTPDDLAATVRQLAHGIEALERLLDHVHRQARDQTDHPLPAPLADRVGSDLAAELHAAHATSLRLFTALNVCAGSLDQIARQGRRLTPALAF